MEYNKFGSKEYVKRDGRRLVASGPRDRQIRAQQMSHDSDTVTVLQDQVKDLIRRLESRAGTSGDGEVNSSQLDDEINKAVEEAIIETRKQSEVKIKNLESTLSKAQSSVDEVIKERNIVEEALRKEIEDLKNNVTSLKLAIDAKEDIINILKSQLDNTSNDITAKDLAQIMAGVKSANGFEFENDDRPQIKTTFIDPLDKSAADSLESHIEIKEEQEQEKKEKIDDKVKRLKQLLGK